MDTGPFAAKLELALKVLSMSRSRMASELGVDKSVIGRWLGGQVRPSAHNLERLTAVVAERRSSFTMLDWDSDLAGFGVALGAPPEVRPSRFGTGLSLPLLDQIAALTDRRAGAYEGFFRTTRPSALMPGRYLHDHGMVRRDGAGLLTYRMGIAGTEYEGWLLPVQNQLFCISTELTSGSMAFAIFNGVSQAVAAVIDGITLSTAMDAGRTIIAAPIVLNYLGPLSGDEEADEARYRQLVSGHPLAPEGSIPPDIEAHLSRDIGPGEMANGGDWMMTLGLARSVARGPLFSDPE
ncbi:MAG: helix-turn-helix transcriptional regulator [Caulobacter sp.]|nr:helix-turn-helix transcriptional regulator [Caulobacter sp.]